jgi:hypothetical protein
MPDPFIFRKVFYLVEATGRRARRLDELHRLVVVADIDAIGYHMHREFLTYKFAHTEYPNDFAYWTARVLGDEIVGERLANLRVFKHGSLSGLKAEISEIIADHLLSYPETANQVAPRGREFNLCNARKFVLTTGRIARDLPEFTGALAEVEASALYYHMFETRYDSGGAGGGRRPNDFADWTRQALGLPRLADKLESFDPYMFSLEQARRALIRLCSEAQAEAEANP